MTIDLRGVFPPVATPFDADGDLDLKGFAANLRRLCRYDLAGVVVLGSNGEFASLHESEKLALLETARGVIGDKLLLAGTGLESTRGTIALTRRAAELGA